MAARAPPCARYVQRAAGMCDSFRSGMKRTPTAPRLLLVVSFGLLTACTETSTPVRARAERSEGGTPAAPPAPAEARDSAEGAGDEPVTPRGGEDERDEVVGPPAVQLIGRFDDRDPLGPRCGWPGCRIIARFEGTRVSVRLNELVASWMDGAPSEWDVEIDGVLQPKLVTKSGEREYVLATGLAPGAHVVELYKRSEAQNGVTQFLGYDFGGGALLPPPARKERRIEIVGDSAAAGFGVEGVGRGPKCPGVNSGATWQNFRKSFGAVLARTLDAELAGTVYSGKGMAKNIWHPDTETMPVIFPRAIPTDPSSAWDFSSFVPDAVIVMIGGNDFAVGEPADEGPATLEEFTEAYEAFTVTLRDNYPAAHLFLVTSPSVSDREPAGRKTRSNVIAGISTIVARRASAGDAKVYSVEPPVAAPSELTGCDGHGSPEHHLRVAGDLAPLVKAKTGW